MRSSNTYSRKNEEKLLNWGGSGAVYLGTEQSENNMSHWLKIVPKYCADQSNIILNQKAYLTGDLAGIGFPYFAK